MCFENYYLVTQFGLPTKANHSWVHGRRPPSARACLGGSTSSLTALGDYRKKVVVEKGKTAVVKLALVYQAAVFPESTIACAAALRRMLLHIINQSCQ